MILQPRYPVSFRAVRNHSARNVVLSYPVDVDVPEITAREVDSVFAINRDHVIRFEGRIYRKVGKVGTAATAEYLNLPFLSESADMPRHITAADGTTYPSRYVDRAGKALANHVYQRLQSVLGSRPREGTLYPSVSDNVYTKGPNTRNECTFERFGKFLSEIDGPAFEAGVEEARREAAKLLIVDGHLWTETPPPVICAEVSGMTQAAVSLRLSFLPDWLDPCLARQYFPVDSREEVMEYAKSLRNLACDDAAYRLALSGISSCRRQQGCELLSFDHITYSQQRTALLLGSDLARCLDADPGKADLVGSNEIETAGEARDLARACGTAWRDWPGMDDVVTPIIEGWLAVGRPRGLASIPGNRHALGSFICRRAMSMSESRPISLTTAFGRSPTP